jgi:hypothetical protein
MERGWRPDQSFAGFEKLRPEVARAIRREFSEPLDVSLFGASVKTYPVVGQATAALAFELKELVRAVDAIIAADKNDFPISQTQYSLVHTDRETGRRRLISLTPLAGYQDIITRVVLHPGIDLSRFARCQVCEGFFYKPRKGSRACCKKCENALLQKEHYHREKQRRDTALRLEAEGKNLFEIADELGVKTALVRRHISDKGSRNYGTKKKRR